MIDFELWSPTKITFGRGAHLSAGAEAARFSDRVLLVYGSDRSRRSEGCRRTVASLEEAGCRVFELGGVRPNPLLSLCRDGILLCLRESIGAVVAYGGGSVIDTAKCICAGALYTGPLEELVNAGVPPEKKIPLIALPTLAGAGSETSVSAVISEDGTNYKKGFGGDSVRPEVALIDPSLTFSAPPEQVAAGSCDIIAHCLERILAPVVNNPVSEGLCLAVARTVLRFAQAALDCPDDYEIRAQLSWCAAWAMGGLQHSGQVSDGTLHVLEHEVSSACGVAHGAGLAAMMPGYFRFLTRRYPARMADIMGSLFDLSAAPDDPAARACAGIDLLEGFITGLGLPARLSGLGVSDGVIEAMAAHACASTGSVGHFIPLDASGCVEVFRACL